MRARPMCIAALGFLLGIVVRRTGAAWLFLLAVGGFLWLGWNRKGEKSSFFVYGRLLFYTAGFLCGIWRYDTEQTFRAVYEPVLKDGMQIVLQGELAEKEYKNNTYLYYLKNCYLKTKPQTASENFRIAEEVIIPCNQVIAEMDTADVPIGKILVLEGSVSVFKEARNEGNFDEKAFYQSQKIDFKLKNVTIQKQYGEANEFLEVLYQLKQRLKQVYEDNMTPEAGGVITMMTLGDKSLLDNEVKELYQKVGISHILAISGLHISVIGMTLYKLLRKLFGSFALSGVLAGSFMFAYGCMTGFRPSAARAVIMFFMMLTAQTIGRSYDSLSALSLSAICLLWENPFLLGYAGFLFSYMAVLGAALAGKIVTDTFEEKHRIRDAIYSAFSIQLMTVPLTAYFYFEVPVYGMAVNFLVLPLMSVLLFFGIAGGIAGAAGLRVTGFILMPCELILAFYRKLSSVVQNLPNATWITGKPQFWRMVLFYGVLALVLYAIWKKKKVRGYLTVGVVLLAFVLYLPKGGMELDILDVGQGDGIYLRTSSGFDVFMDGGSSSISKVGTYRILPFLKCKGVREIDYWFVSHTDKDHISGLEELLEGGYRVKNLVFSEEIVRDESYEELITLARNAGTKVVYMGYLDCLNLKNAKFICVFPYDGFATDDKNEASMVLYYEDGAFDGLFTGDTGEKQEAWIAENYRTWLTVSGDDAGDTGLKEQEIGIDFYKAAHHGSKYSNSAKLLQILKPKTAVISSGINNWYGHPHEEAVKRMEDAGSRIWNTAECGQITIKKEEEGGGR